MFSWILGIGALSVSVGCLVETLRLATRLKHYVREHHGDTIDTSRLPSAMVVIPCKGLQEELPNLEQNLRSVLDQDYPTFRVIFAVGDPDDLAAPIINKLCTEYPNASLVVAKHEPGQGQKIANQLRALQERKQTDQALAFFDSDARPKPDVLQRLIAPLKNDRIGATTGFRWYTPSEGGFGSWLRAAWNAGGMPFLIKPRLNYVWGGAMAIRTDVFDQCGVAEFWTRALSDDLGLTLVVKQAGYTIHFVPDCLVHCPEDLSLPGAIEWTTRQTVVCRVYNVPMWKHIFAGELFTTAAITTGLAVTIAGLAQHAPWLAMCGLASPVVVIASRVLYQARVVALAHTLSPQLATSGSLWKLLLLAPLVSPLMLYNSLRSWVSRRITWRGITYDLRSPTETIIVPNTPEISSSCEPCRLDE